MSGWICVLTDSVQRRCTWDRGGGNRVGQCGVTQQKGQSDDQKASNQCHSSKHWRRMRTGWCGPSSQSCPAQLQTLLGPNNTDGISYPELPCTPCCRTAAEGPEVSAPALLPRCLCCPRCPGVRAGDKTPTAWGKGCWQAAGWRGGPRPSSGNPPQRRQGWPDTDPGSSCFLRRRLWGLTSVLAAV